MLDFFEQQARAKRRTALLLLLYTLGVCLFVAIVTPVLVAFVIACAYVVVRRSKGDGLDPWWNMGKTFFTAPLDTFHTREGQILWALAIISTVMLVFGASIWKSFLLRSGGGKFVAESLGARLVVSGTQGFYQQRLLNVVEEMAIASGMPVPPVYILDDERAINAFAAGYSSSDAVIAVTRGTATSLTREQLQGVIAHEFSHVLGGDMRLNIRLIGIVYGILAVQLLGRLLIDMGNFNYIGGSGGRGRDRGFQFMLALLSFGCIFTILGIAGAFIARIIKAMISRQCEYRADASAVQFTRNPEGLAQALRVVGGLPQRGYIDHANTEECSHMFFVGGVSGFIASLTDSHPPLPNRIRRLNPSWDGQWLAPATQKSVTPGTDAPPESDRRRTAANFAPAGALISLVEEAVTPQRPTYSIASATDVIGALTPAEVFKRLDEARRLLSIIPPQLLTAARDPHDARALILSMLLDKPAGVRSAQLDLISQQLGDPVATLAVQLDSLIHAMGTSVRMPLLEVSLSALASLSPDQYRRFRETLTQAAKLDKTTTLFQTCVQRMLIVHLDRRFGDSKPPNVQYYAINRLGDECSALFTAATIVAGQNEVQATESIFRLCNRLGINNLRRLSTGEFTPASLQNAFSTLATASLKIRVQIVNSCAEIIGQDGKVTAAESELLRAIADGLEVPTALPTRP